MERRYYTPKEVAEILRVSDDAVLDMIRRGDLPALRVSPRLLRIPVAGFDLWRQGWRPKRRQVVIRPASDDAEAGAGIGTDEPVPEGAPSLRR